MTLYPEDTDANMYQASFTVQARKGSFSELLLSELIQFGKMKSSIPSKMMLAVDALKFGITSGTVTISQMRVSRHPLSPILGSENYES